VIADRTAYDVYGMLANYQTGFGADTHDPIQRVEFMNAPKLNPLKRD